MNKLKNAQSIAYLHSLYKYPMLCIFWLHSFQICHIKFNDQSSELNGALKE